MRQETAKLLFDILARSFEREDIKEFHSILNGGMRAVINNKEENKLYQITLRPIEDPEQTIDLDDLANKFASSTQFTGVVAKKK